MDDKQIECSKLSTSKKYAVIFLLVAISLGGCQAGPTPIPVKEASPQPLATATANTPVVLEWLGMQVPIDLWQTEEIKDALYQHGLLTHRSLAGCRAWILSEGPLDINHYTPVNAAPEHFETDKIAVDLWRMVEENGGSHKDTYFEVMDKTNTNNLPPRRMAYFLVDLGDRPIECLEAVHTLLLSLDPALFPKLDVDQG